MLVAGKWHLANGEHAGRGVDDVRNAVDGIVGCGYVTARIVGNYVDVGLAGNFP